MYERFTDGARKAVQLASEEARRLQCEYIGTEHVLLGLLREGSGAIIARILNTFHLDPQKIRQEVDRLVQVKFNPPGAGKLPQSPKAKKVIDYSIEEARNLNHNYVGAEHLLLGVLRDETTVAGQVLLNLGVRLDAVRREVLSLIGSNPVPEGSARPAAPRPTKTPALDSFGRDLNAAARAGNLDPVLGREKEIEQLLAVLGCRTANNPLLVGPSGVGKSALVAHLAQLSARGEGPEFLHERRVIALNLTWIHVFTRDDAFKEEVRRVFHECRLARNVILFFEDLHTLVGPHGTRGRRYVASVLESALARGHLSCIGAATQKKYEAFLARDTLLGRHFQPIQVQPPTTDETLAILQALRPRYEGHHAVRMEDAALLHAVELADRHFTTPCFPEKAIRVLDRAAALVRMRCAPQRPDLGELETQIERLTMEKEEAVATQDFDRAASLRDQADRLRGQRQARLREREQECRQTAGVVDANAVVEVVRQMTGAALS